MNPDRRTFLSLGVGALAVAAVPAAMRRTLPLVRRRIPIMGTVAEVVIPGRDPAWAHEGMDAAFAALRDVERTMSRFRTDSDVGRLNAGAGAWVDVSSETGLVLEASLAWSHVSDGRFDPCLGRVAQLWDDVPTGSVVPELGDARAGIGAGGGPAGRAGRGAASAPSRPGVQLRMGGPVPRARIVRARAAVDLGGIAKGFAVDRAADALRAYGVTDGLINAGGDLVALGRAPDGRPWLVGVQDPNDAHGLVATVEVEDEAVATSGDYVRWFEHAGRRYHHLIDPETGVPRRTGVRSLTVRADRCIDADAAATALFGASPGVMETMVARAPDGVRVIHEIREETT